MAIMSKKGYRLSADLGRFTMEGSNLKSIQALLVEYEQNMAPEKLRQLHDVLKWYITKHINGKDTSWKKYTTAVALWTQVSEELEKQFNLKPRFGLGEDGKFIPWEAYQRLMRNQRFSTTKLVRPSFEIRKEEGINYSGALINIVHKDEFKKELNKQVGNNGTSWGMWLLEAVTPSLLAAWQWGDKKEYLNQLAFNAYSSKPTRDFAYTLFFEMWSYCDKKVSRSEISMAMDQAFTIAGVIMAPLKAPLSSIASAAVSAGGTAGQAGMKFGTGMAATGRQAQAWGGIKKYDAYKVYLALLEYLANIDLNYKNYKDEIILIEELGIGNNILGKQAHIQQISTNLLCGVDV